MNPNDNNRKEGDDEEDKKIPSFSRMNDFAGGVSINVEEEEVGEETTRRIGGSGFAPSFDAVQFADPQTFSMGPSINTAPVKAMTQTAPSMSHSAGWNLRTAPILPEFHPLERSAVFVPYTTAAEVARRISNVLRDRSIEAHFDDRKAKATCRSVQNVDFRVFLYRGQNTFSHGIIVEVQRRYGASVYFYKDQQAILDAAQGNPVEAPEDAMVTAELPLVSDSEDEEESEASSLATLDFAKRLLSFQSYDSNLLAIQTLSSLTDPAKMGVKTSRAVSNHLLASPEGEVSSKVFALIVDQHDLENELRPIAMTVLANALHYSSSESVHPMLREAIRPVLLKELENAEKNPQMAFLAARCLEPLVKGDHNVGDLYNVLDQAQSVGEARHAGLRDQCQKCIRLVDGR